MRVEPNSEPCVSPAPSSPSVALPRKIAPAFLSLATTKPSRSRPVVLEQHRAQCRRHALHVGLILHDDRNAVQRADEARLLQMRVEPVGFLERGGIERDQRVDRRAFLVVGRDPIEIELHQLPDGKISGFESRVNISDCRIDDVEDIREHVCSSSCWPIGRKPTSIVASGQGTFEVRRWVAPGRPVRTNPLPRPRPDGVRSVTSGRTT